MMRKLAFYSLALLVFFSFCGWYLWPYISTKRLLMTIGPGEYRQYLERKPIYVKELPPSSNAWPEIRIADVAFKIPIANCIDISSGFPTESTINFKFKTGSLSIGIRTPGEEYYFPYPALYQIFNTFPSDISIFNTRGINKVRYESLFAKGIMNALSDVPYEINIMNKKDLKAAWTKSGNPKKEFSASAYIYNQSESISVSIYISGYNTKKALESDLYQIIGGTSIPERKIDRTAVIKDIQKIIKNFKN